MAKIVAKLRIDQHFDPTILRILKLITLFLFYLQAKTLFVKVT